MLYVTIWGPSSKLGIACKIQIDEASARLDPIRQKLVELCARRCRLSREEPQEFAPWQEMIIDGATYDPSTSEVIGRAIILPGKLRARLQIQRAESH